MGGKQVDLCSKQFETRLRGLWSLVLSRELNLRICICVGQCLLVSVCLRAFTRSAFPAELSLALSKSSVDPYSVLGKRNQENIAALAAEIEMLQVVTKHVCEHRLYMWNRNCLSSACGPHAFCVHPLATDSVGTLLIMQGEVATARAEANEMKIRATEADEMAKMEKMRRESEEKLRLDATEREKKVNKRPHSLARSRTRTQRTHIRRQTNILLTLCGACK